MSNRARRQEGAVVLRRFLVEVWWEPRERRAARAQLRGRVSQIPQGEECAFSELSELSDFIAEAMRRPAAGSDQATNDDE